MPTLANKHLNSIARLVLLYGYGTEPTAKLLEDSLQRGQEWMDNLARQDIAQKSDYQQKYIELLEKMAAQNSRPVREESYYMVGNSGMYMGGGMSGRY